MNEKSTACCGHAQSEHGEDGCYTFLFDPERQDLVRYCACRVTPAEMGRRSSEVVDGEAAS